jgi:hypothetical protein
MTALTTVPDTSVRPVPWSRLVWVVWRRYRFTLAGTAGILAVLAADLVITGVRTRSAYAAVLACAPNNSAQCRFGFVNFHGTYAQVGLVGVILVFLPGLVGAFAGAPILARELETGTFRYTWTQGVGRMRWAIAVLVPGAVGVAVIIGAFGILVSWQQQPLVDSGMVQRMHSTNFSVTGIACAGWGLLGFGLGVLAGLLWRRVLPAVVTAFAAWFGLAFLAANVLRPGYQSALTTTSLNLADTDLPVSQWWTKGGATVTDAQINSALQAVGVQIDNSGGPIQAAASSGGSGGSVDPVQYLLQHGYLQVTSYQPDSRFWTFQWIEFGWLTALTILTLGATLWLLRRRSA